MSFWDTLRIGASGLSAQRLRLDLISNNIANAETTRTDNGGPYQRQDVVFKAQNGFASFLPTDLQNLQINNSGHTLELGNNKPGGVDVAQITTDKTPGQRVYDPTHPDADKDGYVTYPNVDLVVEMTNMLSATRSYEANLQMIDAAKRMASKALDIGK
jgi:flagellar basal-body rod protein FlgC